VNTVAGGTFIGLLFLIWIAVLILPTIFFILTQQRALSKCSPANQTMSPGLAWLQIIPVFGFIWQFFVVSALANSLGNEFRARGIQEEDKPGYGVGLAMCITRICVIIPILGFFSLVASLVLWIIYWVKIAGFSQKLDLAPRGQFAPSPYGGGYYGPGTTGIAPYPGAPGAAPYASGGGQQPGYAGVPQAPAPAASPLPGQPSPVGSQPCATCGASVPAGQAFCSQCGTKV
jgi:hypothetical protein